MADRYREIHAAFRWNVPRDFNIAHYACTRWAHTQRTALVWEDESGARRDLGYREVQAEANRLSNVLAGLGVARGDRVALLLAQRPETIVTYFACFQMGAIAVPLSFQFGPDALRHRLADSAAKVAIVDAGTAANLEPVRSELPALSALIGVAGARLDTSLAWEEALARASSEFAAAATSADDPAAIIYTSGTTGPPKGTLLAHRSLIGNLPGFEHSHDGFPQEGDVFWTPSDWAWTGGLWDALMPTLYHGCTMVGFHGRFDPERAFRLMARHNVRNAFLVPTALKMMMKAYPAPRRHFDLKLRSLMSGGEAMGPAVFHWAREELGVTPNEIFGQTEMNYIVGNSHLEWPVRPGSMGRPYPGHRVAVIDGEGRECARGTPGEVALATVAPDGTPDPVLFLGYWNAPAATEAKRRGEWYTTGDEATMDDDGYLWYQGRADDVFKSAGYRIGPSEIENCLVRHPAVANAAVVPTPDATRGALITAFVLLVPGEAPSDGLADSIREHVKRHLAPYQQPREIEFVEALPMTTTGKIQRRVLREREARRVTSSDRPKA